MQESVHGKIVLIRNKILNGSLITIIIISASFTLEEFTLGQDGKPELKSDSLMAYRFIYVNPVRSFTDEISIFYEFQNKKNVSVGFSLGYKRKCIRWAESNEGGSFFFFTLEDPNQAIKGKSSGPVARGLINYKIVKGSYRFSYLALHVQYRLLMGNRLEIKHGFNEEYDRYEVTTLSRTNNIAGIQLHIGTRFMDKKTINKLPFSFMSELYLGIGYNAHIYSTIYHSYEYYDSGISNGVIYETDEIPRLENDKGIFYYPTFHIGFIWGIWYKKNSRSISGI